MRSSQASDRVITKQPTSISPVLDETDISDRSTSDTAGKHGSDEHWMHNHGCCMACLMCIGISCYVACPPIPSVVTRKMAFHPPKCAYQLYVLEKDGTKKPAKSAKEIYGKREVGLILTYDKKAPQTLELEAAKGDVFSVRTARGNYLVGVRARPRVASKRQVPIVVLQAQPNATDVGQFLDPRVATIGDMANYFGCDVYMFDYSGYGRSTGSPSEKDAYSDIRAVYDYILNLHAATGVKIVLVGISIGTAVVVDLAAQHPAHLSGVVLVAPFTSGCRLLKNVPGREEPLCCDRFRNFEKADDLNVPVLVIHGMEDDQIPASHGIALAKRLRKKSDLVLVTGGTHSNILAFTSVYSRIRDFVLYGTSQ